jgi:hypothetical protein
MHSPKQIVPSRSITCATIKFSKIGGRHDTLIFHSPLMRLFLSSRTSRAILKALASDPSVSIHSLSCSSSRTLHMPRVCTTPLSMTSLSSSFIWSMIDPLHANLRKRIPSYVTCWTRTNKYPCRYTTWWSTLMAFTYPNPHSCLHFKQDILWHIFQKLWLEWYLTHVTTDEPIHWVRPRFRFCGTSRSNPSFFPQQYSVQIPSCNWRIDVVHDHNAYRTFLSCHQIQSICYKSSYNSLWCYIRHFPVLFWNAQWWDYIHSSKAIDVGPHSEAHPSSLSTYQSS